MASSIPITAAIYLIVIAVASVIGFIAVGYDKRAAQRGTRRISERALLTLAALGGAVGVIYAMRLFGHKTSKKGFRSGVAAMLLLHGVAVFYLLRE